MKLNWMPLDVPDYLADTSHLGALEHGIYLLLMFHYWQTGGLPADDRQLARIARATPEEWQASKPVIEAFFRDGWKHKRIDFELNKAREISETNQAKARGAANARWSKQSGGDAPSNATSTSQAMLQNAPLPSPLPSHEESKILNLGDVKREASPPRHCATTTKGGGRVYVVKGTPEWEAYAADYRAATGQEPYANQHGGKWFKKMGEAS
jgi:uncharacterized protein YdaU (DUF1376 family)